MLHKRAGQIMELVQKTQEEMASTGEDVSGVIYVGAGETQAFRVIATSLKDLMEQYPCIHFHLYSGNSEDVMERLDKGLLDFGLFIEPYNVTKYNYLRLPLVDRWGVLMRKDSPLAALDAIRAEDLWSVPLISSRQALEGGQLSSWLKIAPEKLRIVGTYNLLFNASLMVESGAGYALCLEGIVNTTGESNLCFRPLSPALKSNVNFAWKKNQIFSKPAELLIVYLQKQSHSHTS